VIEYSVFLHGLAQQWSSERNKIWHKGSLGDEDDSTEKMRNTTLGDEK